ncbi:MAG: alpha-methylacyl-CoA racemase [Myxococcota bacterium]|jgi:alpha-methylacyl-CoA racemase
MGPLDGVKVLDLSRLLPGPACTWMLHGLGASVDRVETPGRGDFARHIPPFVDGVGVYFACVSRGKRSIAIDLRAPGGPDLVRDLVGRYDVLVEGFRPGVMEAMGLDPVLLVEENPGLVVARLSGFGQAGGWQDRVGHDINYVGVAGLLSAAAHDANGPALPPVQVADFGGASVAAMGIAAALFERERERAAGRSGGRVLDVSLAEAALVPMAPLVLSCTADGRPPVPGGEVLTGALPIYGCYACADGKWITVGALEPKFQAELVRATGGLDREHLASVFRTATRDEWVERLSGACVGPVLMPDELAGHSAFAGRGAVERLGSTTWVRAPFATGPAGSLPALGEHTEAVLSEAGLADRIAGAREAGVIA